MTRTAQNFSASLPIRLTVSSLLRAAGVCAWRLYRGRGPLHPPKSTEGNFGIPKKSSVWKLALLPECFGLSVRRKKLQLLQDVASAISNSLLLARKNGLAMLWQSSSRKSLSVIVSGTCA